MLVKLSWPEVLLLGLIVRVTMDIPKALMTVLASPIPPPALAKPCTRRNNLGLGSPVFFNFDSFNKRAMITGVEY
jgi:hypothetical protein